MFLPEAQSLFATRFARMPVRPPRAPIPNICPLTYDCVSKLVISTPFNITLKYLIVNMICKDNND